MQSLWHTQKPAKTDMKLEVKDKESIERQKILRKLKWFEMYIRT